MRVVHVTLRGRVQGVGYRAWCAGEARARGLNGWGGNPAGGGGTGRGPLTPRVT